MLAGIDPSLERETRIDGENFPSGAVRCLRKSSRGKANSLGLSIHENERHEYRHSSENARSGFRVLTSSVCFIVTMPHATPIPQ